MKVSFEKNNKKRGLALYFPLFLVSISISIA
nr:MAG TPA: hypothetical protein [Caudoviricetes sp.]